MSVLAEARDFSVSDFFSPPAPSSSVLYLSCFVSEEDSDVPVDNK